MRQKLANARVDVFIARIAALQHGVITTAQLVHIGLDHAGVTRRVAAGRLHRVHRGVYAVGHAALNSEGRWMAAVLACGEGAVLSHESAAVLWRLLRHRRGPVHVTVPDCGGRARREGITIHRSVTLATSHTAVRNQISRHEHGPNSVGPQANSRH